MAPLKRRARIVLAGRCRQPANEGEKISFDLEDDRKGGGKKSATNLRPT
jgi:cold shock CspA family protein